MKKYIIFTSIIALIISGFFLSPFIGEEAIAKTNTFTLKDRVLGNKNAPITMIEYASFTCSHCSTSAIEVMPTIKKKYIDTGKLKLIYRDFPMDPIGLHAAALTRCMPEKQYYPLVKIIQKNYRSWIKTSDPDKTIMQYAQMAGLDPDKAKACVKDTKMMDALISMRKEGNEKYSINATPTFIFNDGEAKIEGAQPLENFIKLIDKLLAKHKKQ